MRVELRQQVLKVVKMSDACESKKEIMRLKSDLQVRIVEHAIGSWIVLSQFQDYHNLVIRQFQERIFISVLVPR